MVSTNDDSGPAPEIFQPPTPDQMLARALESLREGMSVNPNDDAPGMHDVVAIAEVLATTRRELAEMASRLHVAQELGPIRMQLMAMASVMGATERVFPCAVCGGKKQVARPSGWEPCAWCTVDGAIGRSKLEGPQGLPASIFAINEVATSSPMFPRKGIRTIPQTNEDRERGVYRYDISELSIDDRERLERGMRAVERVGTPIDVLEGATIISRAIGHAKDRAMLSLRNRGVSLNRITAWHSPATSEGGLCVDADIRGPEITGKACTITMGGQLFVEIVWHAPWDVPVAIEKIDLMEAAAGPPALDAAERQFAQKHRLIGWDDPRADKSINEIRTEFLKHQASTCDVCSPSYSAAKDAKLNSLLEMTSEKRDALKAAAIAEIKTRAQMKQAVLYLGECLTKLSLAADLPRPVWSEICRLDSYAREIANIEGNDSPILDEIAILNAIDKLVDDATGNSEARRALARIQQRIRTRM